MSVGDGGCDAAGENTPTPESPSSVSSDAKYARGGAASGVPAGLLRAAAGDGAACTRMAGVPGAACSVGLSLVDALTASTTPSVRAMTYDAMSCGERG